MPTRPRPTTRPLGWFGGIRWSRDLRAKPCCRHRAYPGRCRCCRYPATSLISSRRDVPQWRGQRHFPRELGLFGQGKMVNLQGISLLRVDRYGFSGVNRYSRFRSKRGWATPSIRTDADVEARRQLGRVGVGEVDGRQVVLGNPRSSVDLFSKDVGHLTVSEVHIRKVTARAIEPRALGDELAPGPNRSPVVTDVDVLERRSRRSGVSV